MRMSAYHKTTARQRGLIKKHLKSSGTASSLLPMSAYHELDIEGIKLDLITQRKALSNLSPSEARVVAMKRLYAAGLIDKDGKPLHQNT